MLKDTQTVNKPRRRPQRPRASWQDYEREKRKLAALNLSPDEYERQIEEITKRLGV